MKTSTQTASSLVLRVAYDDGDEKTIGFCNNLTFSVNSGQKVTYGVDSPYPLEIAQGATASFVRGNLNLYLPKGSTMESVGLVPYRISDQNENIAPLSRSMHLRIYDRSTQNLILSADYCKIGNYTVGISARGIVQISAQFDGMYVTPGMSI